MTRILYFGCDFLYTAVRIWGIRYLMVTMSTPRKNSKKECVIWGILIFALAGLNTYNHILTTTFFSNTFMMMIVILLSVLSSITYKIRIWDSFVVVYFLWIGTGLADFLFQTYAYVFLTDMNLRNTVFLTGTIFRGIYLLLCSIIFIVIMRSMSRFIKNKSSELKKSLGWYYFLIPILGFCLVYFQRVYKSLVSEQVINRWLIFLTGIFLFILFLVCNHLLWKEREKTRILCLERDLLQKNYASMLNLYEDKKIVLHDLKKHLQVIREMTEEGEKQEILKYLDQLGGKIEEGFNRNITNHGLLDLILSQKFQEAENSKISIQYDSDDMSEMLLESTEICALFSNLLDNAIEANRKIEKEEERWMKITCKRKKEWLIIFISNPMIEQKLEFQGRLPKTTKKDKWRHGIGMKSVTQIVYMHDGHMVIETEKGIFAITVCVKGFS